MPISSRTRLGPYEIQTLLGSGGMGEVYLARDMRLGRIVAVKVISDRLSRDESARDRFRREASAASALNHPNICTIFDVGEWEGRPFLAMEYVDGQSLASLLRGTPLALGEILDLFSKLASALEAAHAHGVIHRDIKPANIVLTTHNQPKIMDFGLAKLMVPPKAIALIEPLSATWSEPEEMLTAPTAAIGTVAYMSPEQARGEELDTRTDLFSLGLILYEAATGQRAFQGNTAAVIFTELLRGQPAPALKLNPALPPQLNSIIDKAIEKDRDLRYQHASDLLADLKRLQREVDSGAVLAMTFAPVKRHRWLAPAVAALIAALVAVLWFISRPPAPLRPQAVTANSVENTIVQSTISPDDRTIAYGDRLGIHLETISTPHDTRSIPRPGSFSRDATWWPVDWFPDGIRLLAASTTETHQGLKYATWVVSTFSGTAIKIRDDSIAQAVSPDGALIAFTAGGVSLTDEIWVMGPQGEDARKIESAGNAHAILSSLHWSPDGRRIIYRKELIEDGRVSVENKALDNTPPVTVAADAHLWGDFCYLSNGAIIYSASAKNAPKEDMHLWELAINSKTGAPSGHPKQLTDWTNFEIENISLSRDGARLAFNKVEKQTDVYVTQVRGREILEKPRRLTLDDYNDNPSFWSQDSKFIYFSSDEPGSYQILRQDINEDQPEVVVTSTDSMDPIRMTPDGSSFLYVDHANGKWELRIAPISGGASEPFEFDGRVLSVTCAWKPATNCMIDTLSADQKHFVFSGFDLPDRTVHRLFELQPNPGQGMSWTLSPNGTEIAMLRNYPESAEIDVYNLKGELVREVKVKGFNRLLSVDWAADNRSWFVGAPNSTGCSLLHVFSDGSVQMLANMRGRGMRTFGIAAPNGQSVAFLGWTIVRNAYVVDNISSLR
ncbi:MAG: protein kinase [Bryobacteraceae bacterium]